MPAPSTVEEFLDLVRRSNIVDEKRYEAYIEQVKAANALPTDPGKLAGYFVRDGLLTRFQAQQVLMGKWRRFNIGKYKVLEQLGSGGMGSVYLCEHTLMRRRVAVKVLPTARADDPSALDRFHREARAVAALDHPNIVRAYDIDQDDRLHFLVMEYVDGASLQEIIKRTGPMDITRAAHYIRLSALGLQHAHVTANLVHRDIKPGNILVDRHGAVKVLDMGLARFFGNEEDIITKKYDESVLGTADYLAPEQAIDSHTVDIRADIYSLGATFYFLLAGNPPFAEGTVAQKLIWHQTRNPKPIREIRPEVPERLAKVLEKMMAKRPEDRYQRPDEVAQALEPWTTTQIPPPPEEEMPQLSPAALGTAPSDLQFAGKDDPSSPTRRAVGPGTQRSPTPRRLGSPGGNEGAGYRPAAGQGGAQPPQPLRRGPAPSPAGLNATPNATKGQTAAQTPPGVGALPNSVQKARLGAKVEDDTAPWEQFEVGIDTPSPAEGPAPAATARSTGQRSATKVAGAGKKTSRAYPFVRWIIAGGVAAVVVITLIIVLAITLSSGPGEETEEKPPPRRRTWEVAESAQLLPNLQLAQPGDTLVLKTNLVEAQLTLGDALKINRNLTLEVEPGREVTWRLPKTASSGALLSLSSVEGLRIRGVRFDGSSRQDELLVARGSCPGLVIEDCQFENFRTSGLRLLSCEGKETQPVLLQRLRFRTSGPKAVPAAIVLEASPKFLPQAVSFVSIRECEFTGKFDKPVKLEGSPISILDFSFNRYQAPGQTAVTLEIPR